MASAKIHKRQRFSLRTVFMIAVMLFVACAVALYAVGSAVGSAEVDSSTIGVGEVQSTSEGSVSAADRIAGSSDEGASSANLSTAATRSITVKDPDPVVVPVAVDTANSTAVEKAKKVCTMDPLPTAPRVAPDVHDGTWSSGTASAYSIADNDDGAGNFNTTVTASGRALSTSGVTVAVPEGQKSRLGSVVEICYDGKVVIATVTDTGGFARYGRSLDLAPGVYKAFGCSSPSDWGTRTVYYRYL